MDENTKKIIGVATIGAGIIYLYIKSKEPEPPGKINGVIEKFIVVGVPSDIYDPLKQDIHLIATAKNTGGTPHDFGFGVSFKDPVSGVYIDFPWINHIIPSDNKEYTIYSLIIPYELINSYGLSYGKSYDVVIKMWKDYDITTATRNFVKAPWWDPSSGILSNMLSEKWYKNFLTPPYIF